ncbi:hypothetical protein ACIPLR_12135 [Herbaspirillum huttiense]|uniref:hypothetical protein n=1 Tax=Herbaspirillum huttiense TaxID=863372 RepID=UPI003815FC49
MSYSQEQMEPYPKAEDLDIPPLGGAGHGAQMCKPPRRGVLVTVRCLKSRGVNLSPSERRKVPPITGELKISRVPDRAEFHSIAEIVSFNQELDAHLRYFPARLMCLLNPEILWLDGRGMVIYGIERLGGIDGPQTSYWQTWQVVFGIAEPAPPF